MNPESHQRAKQIFLQACELPAEQRSEFVCTACDADAELLALVNSMLKIDEADHELLDNSPALVSDGLSAGERLGGRYVVREPLGEGGLGEVWLADQIEPIQRQVAIKVIKLGMDTRRVVARFEAERQTLAMLEHPNIARVYDAGSTSAGRPYFVMESIDGRPLTDYADSRELGLEERIELFLSVCSAVQYAHQRGVIHRDIKPSNVLVAEQDGHPTCKVIDFGISKAIGTSDEALTLATLEHQLIGTPAYMSPEQAEGSRDIDTRADVYSLGVLFYELMTGRTPFDRDRLRDSSIIELVRIIREEIPDRPSTSLSKISSKRRSTAHRPLVRTEQLRGDLDWIALKALEKDRARRYASPQTLADDLSRYLANEPVLAGSPSRLYRTLKFAQRNRTAVAGGLLVLVALTFGYITTGLERDRAVEAEIEASEAAARAIAALDAERLARLETENALIEADAASDFLSDLLGSADPEEGNWDVRVVDVLQRADQEISSTFHDRPRIEIRLRRTLGITYRRLGMLPQAVSNLERAAAVAREMRVMDQPEFLNLLGSLAAAYDEQRRFDLSEPLHREVLELNTLVNGPDARSTLGAQCNFGLFLYDLQRYEEAEVQLRKTLAGMEQHLAENDVFLMNCMQGLGTTLMDLGRIDEAREIFAETLRRADSIGSGADVLRVTAFGNLAQAEHKAKRYESSLEWFARSLEAIDRTYPARHWRRGHMLAARAVVKHDSGDTSAALSDAELALEIYFESFGPRDPETQAFLTMCVGFCKLLGRPERAEELREQFGAD